MILFFAQKSHMALISIFLFTIFDIQHIPGVGLFFETQANNKARERSKLSLWIALNEYLGWPWNPATPLTHLMKGLLISR